MTDKMIEEMAKAIEKMEFFGSDNYTRKLSPTCINIIATNLYNLGYRKIPEGSVVLSKEEYLNDFNNQFNKGYKHGSKETARDILKEIMFFLPLRETSNIEIKTTSLSDVTKAVRFLRHLYIDKVKDLAKQYGVDLGE